MSSPGTDDLLGVMPRQDYVIFPGGLKTPGVCEIVGLSSPRNWNIQQGYGLSGATTIYAGTAAVKFKIVVKMWRSLDFVQWELLARLHLAKPPPFIKPLALGVSHPQLTTPPHNISEIVIEDVEGPTQDDDGLWIATIHCLEWKKPLPALGKPLAAIPAANVAAPTAQDAADKEIAAKVATLKGLAGG